MLGLDAQPAGEKSFVKDTTTAAFRADVVAESAKQPVLVDFWAPWCGPCKQLTPVLERVVQSAEGKVRLVKMNIDEHPQIPGQLGIQSIPAVIAFQNGQPADGFMGALPESQIKAFIERLVGPLRSEADELLDSAEEAFAAGQFELAAESFARAGELAPGNLKAAAGHAKALVELGEFDAARDLLDSLPPAAARDQGVAAARAALEIAVQAADAGDVGELNARLAADPDDHQARLELAIALNAKGQRNAASDALVEIIRRNRTWNEDAARKQLLQFFEGWGPMDPDTIAGRRKLSTVLFS